MVGFHRNLHVDLSRLCDILNDCGRDCTAITSVDDIDSVVAVTAQQPDFPRVVMCPDTDSSIEYGVVPVIAQWVKVVDG